jgi:hypothetical protein
VCVKLCVLVIGQVAEPQVNRLCMEAEECMAMNKWVELASLMLTSADLIFSKVAEKGVNAFFSIGFYDSCGQFIESIVRVTKNIIFFIHQKNCVKHHSALCANKFAICYWFS